MQCCLHASKQSRLYIHCGQKKNILFLATHFTVSLLASTGPPDAMYLFEALSFHFATEFSVKEHTYCGPALAHWVLLPLPSTRIAYAAAAAANLSPTATNHVVSCIDLLQNSATVVRSAQRVLCSIRQINSIKCVTCNVV